MSALRRAWTLAAGYALVLFALGADRYATYRAGSDLGLFTQAIATVFHGFADAPERGSHFTFHFSPILYVCAPLLLATHSPLALTAIQAVACALTLPAIYLIARRRMSETLAFGVSVVVALYPPFVGATFTDFHENAFAPAAVMWLLWAVDARRYSAAAAFLLVALSIKEDQSVLLGFAAFATFAYALVRRDRGLALFCAASCVVSLGTFAFFFGVVRSLAGARDVWAPTHFYTWSHVVDPRGSAPWYSIGRPAYFAEAMVPLAFACFASPAIVLALPGFAEVLGSHESITYTMGTHYAAVWIPWVLFAFVLGIGNMYARRPLTARNFVRTATVLCVLILAFASPTHWGHYLGPRTHHDAVLDRAAALIGSHLDVGTFDEMYAHVGFDPHAELGLEGAPRYALVDSTYARSWFTVRYRPLLQRAVARGRERVVWSDDGVELYERTGSGGAVSEDRARVRGRGGIAGRAGARGRRALDRRRRSE